MKLIILVQDEWRIKDMEIDNPIEIDDNGGWRGGLPEYGADHARYFKNDIVMLEEGPMYYLLVVDSRDISEEHSFMPVSDEWVAAEGGVSWLQRYPDDIAMVVEAE